MDLDAERSKVEATVKSSGHNLVHWRAELAEVPALIMAVEKFEPLENPAAHACTDWLREHSLNEPQESVPWLYIRAGQLFGFFALGNGQAQLGRQNREEPGLYFRTQPAVLITQIARDASMPGAGVSMMVRATGLARRATRYSAATVLALDPHDHDTPEMWKSRYGFRDSELPPPGREESDLRRLWLRERASLHGP